MSKEDRARQVAIGMALAGSGEVIVLDNGSAASASTLWRRALRNGFDGQYAVFAKRIAKGMRNFEELCKPVNSASSSLAKSSLQKRKQDPEFLAALAAVAARRGAR